MIFWLCCLVVVVGWSDSAIDELNETLSSSAMYSLVVALAIGQILFLWMIVWQLRSTLSQQGQFEYLFSRRVPTELMDSATIFTRAAPARRGFTFGETQGGGTTTVGSDRAASEASFMCPYEEVLDDGPVVDSKGCCCWLWNVTYNRLVNALDELRGTVKFTVFRIRVWCKELPPVKNVIMIGFVEALAFVAAVLAPDAVPTAAASLAPFTFLLLAAAYRNPFCMVQGLGVFVAFIGAALVIHRLSIIMLPGSLPPLGIMTCLFIPGSATPIPTPRTSGPLSHLLPFLIGLSGAYTLCARQSLITSYTECRLRSSWGDPRALLTTVRRVLRPYNPAARHFPKEHRSTETLVHTEIHPTKFSVSLLALGLSMAEGLTMCCFFLVNKYVLNRSMPEAAVINMVPNESIKVNTGSLAVLVVGQIFLSLGGNAAIRTGGALSVAILLPLAQPMFRCWNALIDLRKPDVSDAIGCLLLLCGWSVFHAYSGPNPDCVVPTVRSPESTRSGSVVWGGSHRKSSFCQGSGFPLHPPLVANDYSVRRNSLSVPPPTMSLASLGPSTRSPSDSTDKP